MKNLNFKHFNLDTLIVFLCKILGILLGNYCSALTIFRETGYSSLLNDSLWQHLFNIFAGIGFFFGYEYFKYKSEPMINPNKLYIVIDYAVHTVAFWSAIKGALSLIWILVMLF